MITGASGFVGGVIQQYLAAHMAAFDLELIPPSAIDLRDASALAELCAETRPDRIIHLAAQSFVPQSFADPFETFDINFIGTLNLLQALKKSGFNGKMLFVGTGDVYGRVAPESLPVSENQPLKPRNPYAVSKVAAEALCYQWSQTENMHIVMARPFNHIGPGQSERFAVSDFAKQIVEIKLGKRDAEIFVGDIDVTRDFTDVRDVVRAYIMLLEGRSGEIYNVCSGKEVSIRRVLEQLISLAGVHADIKQDGARFRPAEQRRVYGSCDKLAADTGWAPEINLEQSLVDILSCWEWELNHG
jgi:GDP-4-dehydro-6-deoxy-D-mannose reductase